MRRLAIKTVHLSGKKRSISKSLSNRSHCALCFLSLAAATSIQVEFHIKNHTRSLFSSYRKYEAVCVHCTVSPIVVSDFNRLIKA